MALGTLARGAIGERTYALAPVPPPGAPILLVLHGAGGAGAGTAAMTGLARRGPAAGFCTVFPDGWGRVWNDQRSGTPQLRRRAGVDDVGFLNALVRRLADEHGAGPAVWACGMSNGGFLAEHLARHDLLPLQGIGLVAATAAGVSRAGRGAPARPASVVMFNGTADPLVPYAGGPIGFMGRIAARRLRGGLGIAAPAEAVAADWAAANGAVGSPPERVPADLPVTRLAWSGPRPVVLHRIEGGGHTWPGGGQYLPARIIGPVARALDATGIILEVFSRS
jgi:polyhydroxybutyrate depolymerase